MGKLLKQKQVHEKAAKKAAKQVNIGVLFEDIAEMMDGAKQNLEKFEGGNKSAGTRVRKYMQEIKKKAQEIRNAVTQIKEKM